MYEKRITKKKRFAFRASRQAKKDKTSNGMGIRAVPICGSCGRTIAYQEFKDMFNLPDRNI